MVVTVSNLRRIRRRSNKRKIIKGQGFLEYVRKYLRRAKEWGRQRVPALTEGLRDLAERQLKDIGETGIPRSKEEWKERGKNLAKETGRTIRKSLFGSGKRRLFAEPYRIPGKRLRYGK